MKRLFIFLPALLLALTVQGQVTKNQADSIVLRQVLAPSLINNVDVYRFSQPLSDSDDIQSCWGSTIDAPFQSSWGYFIDLYPFANWSHPCQICFVNTADGSYSITESDLPPYQWLSMDTVRLVPRPVPAPRPQSISTGQRLTPPETDPHLWAVLVCARHGNIMDPYATRRFWGDLSCIYTTLTDVFGFQENTLMEQPGYSLGQTNSHILVLASTDLDVYDTDLNHSSYHSIENDYLCLLPSGMQYHTILGGFYYYSENELRRLFNKLADTLTLEDKLFVYVTGDGFRDSGPDQDCFFKMEWDDNNNMSQLDEVFADEFSDMMKDINCSQITLMMQTNYSEGFIDSFMDTEDALCKNRVVFTSTNCFCYPECYYTPQAGLSDPEVVNEFTYYWAASNLGFYPSIAFDPIDYNQATQGPWDYPGLGLVGSSDPTSCMPWQTFFPNDPYGHAPYDLNPDTDGDNILSLKESFIFADNMDSWSPNGYYLPYHNYSYYLIPDSPKASYESGFTSEAATITGYKGVVDGVVATGADNNRYLLDGDLYININSELEIKDSTTFVSDGKTLTNVGALYTENGLRTACFKNTRICHEGLSMKLDSCVFDSCYVVRAVAGVDSITNSQFIGTDFIGGQNAIRDGLINGLEIVLSNNTFTNSSDKSITMLRVPVFEISGNTIVGGSKGIRLTNCIGLQSDGVIAGNSIQGCTGPGIEAYSSNAVLSNNDVFSNGFGVKVLNNSSLSVLGNQYANNQAQTQRIQNNTKYQIYATKRSFPSQLHYNCIKGVNNSDTLIYYDNAGQLLSYIPLDVEYNCWKPLTNSSIGSVLYSVNGQAFDYLPTWNPQVNMRNVNVTWAQRMLCVADSLSQLGSFGAALDTLQALVEYAPTSEESKVALKSMFAIAEKTGKGFDTLRDYYRNTHAVTCHPDLQDIGDNLANKCDEALGNYQAAIAWYENKLVDSATSFADSVFAVIDLGDLYLLLDSIGERSMVGSMSQYRPETEIAHEEHRDWLVSLLPNAIHTENTQYETVTSPMLAAIPNPTTGAARLVFEVNEEGEVDVVVTDLFGRTKQIKQLGEMALGKHSTEIDMAFSPQGFYLCTLYVNGHPMETCKIVKTN